MGKAGWCSRLMEVRTVRDQPFDLDEIARARTILRRPKTQESAREALTQV
jgi:hypothetical protein